MTTEIAIALVTVLGTAISAFVGAIASGKMTNFRLKKLEDKVDKHNHLIERMAVCEEKIGRLEKK